MGYQGPRAALGLRRRPPFPPPTHNLPR